MDAPTREDIRNLCTEQSFRRGLNYHDEERVQHLDIDGESVHATVQGSRAYEVSVELDGLRTHCTCPYDYAGDCKHIVAVLLAVRERADSDGSRGGDAGDRAAVTDSDGVDPEQLVAETPPEELRSFLRELVAADSDIRDRFVAFAGGETGKTVHDYRREIDQLFDQAAGRGGFIEYGTRIDFSTHQDLAATHRERGDLDEATAIYRALAEAIAANLERTDDSGGHYSLILERAVENYAETVQELTDSHEQRRRHIEYLFERYLDDDYGFVSDYYDDALRTVCVTDADFEYWLELLDEQVSGIDLTAEEPPEPVPLATGDDREVGDDGDATGDASDATGDASNEGHTGEDTATDDEDTGADRATGGEAESSPPEEPSAARADGDVLHASDFTDGPLRVEEFTGGAFEVEHLAVGVLELSQFAGDAFEELHVDEPTTAAEHTLERFEPDAHAGDDTTGTAPEAVDTSGATSTRTLVSSCLYVLSELGREEMVLALYEHSYLENRGFCEAYAERLADRGAYDRALAVLTAGIDTFRSTKSLRWAAAECYRERGRDGDEERYRETLTDLFLDHGDWGAYERLKRTVPDEEWPDLRDELVDRFDAHRRQTGLGRGNTGRRLVELFLREGETERAFEMVVDSETLHWLQRYREDVGAVDPEEYFEVYREQLVPFAANETGRKHYREIATHLEELQALGLDERFAEFLTFLKEEHSNRPAFLDELETAGF